MPSTTQSKDRSAEWIKKNKIHLSAAYKKLILAVKVGTTLQWKHRTKYPKQMVSGSKRVSPSLYLTNGFKLNYLEEIKKDSTF